MNRLKLHKKPLVWVSLLVLFNFSCKKFVEIEPPIDKLQSDLVFTNDRTAEASVTGLYRKFLEQQSGFGSYPITLYAGLSADELYSTSVNGNRDEFQNNAITVENSTIDGNLWSRAYEYIYHANACLEGLEESDMISQNLKDQLVGEMKFIRAFHYFYLINLFGDVPLILTTDYRKNAIKPRTVESEVYKQIIDDLEQARNLLKPTYPSAGKARPNKWTATALLARVNLYRQNWSASETLSGEIINTGTYTLIKNNLDTVFWDNNKEAIWQITTPPTFAVLEASTFIPTSPTGSSRPTVAISDSLVKAFELTTDKRKTYWTFTKALTPPVSYSTKYKNRTATTNPNESITVFRLAEQYLIRAEARARNNDLVKAVEDINVIRTRAGLTALPTIGLTQTGVLQAIEKERRVELFVEWGHRWFDLKRTGRVNAVLSIYKGSNWQPTDALYPVPFDQILRNPFLTQNPGY